MKGIARSKKKMKKKQICISEEEELRRKKTTINIRTQEGDEGTKQGKSLEKSLERCQQILEFNKEE